jgi:hypothetical protein
MTAGQKAARTRKRRAAGAKAARTRKLRAAGRKAAQTRKRKTAGKKAALTRTRRAAGRKAAQTRKRSRIHSGLAKLDARIASGRLGRAQPWGGADIIIAAARPPVDDQHGFHSPKDYVVTQFVAELSWLFESLRDVFRSSIDFQSKYPFYGRLAAAADRYSDGTPVQLQTAGDLLSAVLKEAKQMAGDFA